MFNKLKQKIADGVEGVSAGRQTPLSPLERNAGNTTPEVGRAQAQNNGRIDEVLDVENNAQIDNNFPHPLDENYMTSTPLEISHEDDPQRTSSSSSLGQRTPQRRNSRTRRLSSSSTMSNSSVQGEKSYGDSDMETSMRTDSLSVNELRELYRKQDKSLKRYKHKFSELVDAYKSLQKDKEKLETTLTSGQDKQMRRLKELKETIELEQEGKRHLEETLRIEMGEKDDKIHVLKTQIDLLKTKHGVTPSKDRVNSPSGMMANGGEWDHDVILELQDKIKLLNTEIETLTTDNELAHAMASRSEQEKKTAIEGVMNNMHEMLNEQEDLRSEIQIFREELNNRDITILRMREDEDKLEGRLRVEMASEMKDTVMVDALKEQESGLQTIFEEKEAKLKNLFADKVHDLQRVMEESEKQKQLTLQQSDSEVTKKNDEILVLNEQLNEWNEKENKVKMKIQKMNTEREGWEKTISECLLQVEQEKAKYSELGNQHAKELKEKQEEFNEQLGKLKRTSQTKVYECQDQLRKKSAELTDTIQKHKTEFDSKLKESQHSMQSEHVKTSRKLEVKVSDMKKLIKELRQKLNEKEGKCSELETSLLDAHTEVDQAKSLNTTLAESEQKAGQLSCDVELMVEEVSEWKNKYELLYNSFNDISIQYKDVEDKLTEKEKYIGELTTNLSRTEEHDEKLEAIYNELGQEKTKCLEITRERDHVTQQMEYMVANLKEDENTLQNDLNNLKTRFSYVEEESKELTQQLHDKVKEIESLTRNLDIINKELTSKEEMFAQKIRGKTKENDTLKEKYDSVIEEKQQMEYKHNEKVFELEEQKSQSESRIKEEYDVKLQMKDEELKAQLTNVLHDKDSTVEKVTLKLEEMRKEELTEIENRHERELNELHNDLKIQIDNVGKKHKEFINNSQKEHAGNITTLELKYKEEMKENTTNHEKDINYYKSQIETVKQQKYGDFNELSAKHAEDRNILLKQIDEQSHNLTEMNMLCQQKDKEYGILSEKLDKEMVQYSEVIKTHDSAIQEKLNEQEKVLKEKQQSLEKKFKKIINDRDKKNKLLLEEAETKHVETIQSLENSFNTKEIEFSSQSTENYEQINILKQKIEDGNRRLMENTERYDNELSTLKSREKDAWAHLEQIKMELSTTKDNHVKEITSLQSRLLENKNVIEELNLKLMSGESNSKEIDTKFSELLVEKSKLEQKLSNDKNIYDDRIRRLEGEINGLKAIYDENIRKLEDKHAEAAKSFENEKIEILRKYSVEDELNNNKLLDLKKKAEQKISKLKKDHNEKINNLESMKTELREKIVQLEKLLEDKTLLHEENTQKNLEEYQISMKDSSDKFNIEITSLKDELLIKSEKVEQLGEVLDNCTVDKMDSLKLQKTHLDEEHNAEIKRLQEEMKVQTDMIERKLSAKVDEKDFEHNAELKSLMKRFHVQLGGKDQEIQQATQEAIEIAQKDERRIINEYDEQINEMRKELHLREKDMLQLQEESQHQLDLNHEELESQEKLHHEQLTTLQQDYNLRLEDLTKRHEEALLDMSQNNTSLEEAESRMNEHLNEVEQKFAVKTQETEDYHRNEILAQEKKFKIQMKQAKTEMRKLLVGKGVNIPNGDYDPSFTISSNNSSDSEMEPSEIVKLKEKVTTMSKELHSLRERDKLLSMQAEQFNTPKRNDRPATLHLSDNNSIACNSPPKSPQPLEFEYLRNILYNFMMGKQRKQMAKVLTAIVHFTPSQVQQILSKVEEQESQVEKKKGSSWL